MPCCSGRRAPRAGERRYYFDNGNGNDSERGLVQHTVNGFFQDRAGFIWIATQGGLHKYDGYRVRVFEHSADDPEESQGSFVNDPQDGEDALWIGAQRGRRARRSGFRQGEELCGAGRRR